MICARFNFSLSTTDSSADYLQIYSYGNEPLSEICGLTKISRPSGMISYLSITGSGSLKVTSLLVVHPGRNSALEHVPAKIYSNMVELPKKPTFGNR